LQDGVAVGTISTSGISPQPFINIIKNHEDALIDTTKPLFINGNRYDASSTSAFQFEVPPVTNTNPSVQDGKPFRPWIKTQQSSRVTIPDALSIASLSVSGTVAVGSITDLEAKISLLESRLNQVKQIVNPSLW
jgi:hypothetical protein